MRPRDNPFAAHRIEGLAFRLPAGRTWDALFDRGAAMNWRGAIVGPHGSGKTTLLEQLAPRLIARGFTPQLCRIQAASTLAEKAAVFTRVRAMRAPDFLLLDGAEQFTTREGLSLYSSASKLAGCVITVHRTSRLPTLLEMHPSPALLAELAAELTGEPLGDAEAAARYKRHAGNLRECLRELYDQHALA